MNERIEKAKQHFKEHREAYISSAVTAGVVAAGMVLYKPPMNVARQNMIALVNWKGSQVVNQVAIEVKRKGTLSNVVEHLETGDIYRSQNDAAKALNLDPSNLSRHLQGKLEHVKGQHLKVVGDRAQ